MRFFICRRNSEEFLVILGIVRNRSERPGSPRCPQELMEFPVEDWREHSVKPALKFCHSSRLSVSWLVVFLPFWRSLFQPSIPPLFGLASQPPDALPAPDPAAMPCPCQLPPTSLPEHH